MNTVSILTSSQAAVMAETLKLIKAEKAILTLNVAPNGKYMQNSLVFANEGEQVQAVIWSTAKEGTQAQKTELTINTKIVEALDTLKTLNGDIEIRENNGEYYFFVKDRVPSVPIKVLAEKPEINTPDQATLIAQYQVGGKELSTKLTEADRTDASSTQEISKAVTMIMSPSSIRLVSGDGPTIGKAVIEPKAYNGTLKAAEEPTEENPKGNPEESKPVAIPAKYTGAVKKVASMATENVSIAVFGSSIAIGSQTLVYMASLGTSVMPQQAVERIDSWCELTTEAKFTVDSDELQGLINVLRIGAIGSKLTKPAIIFSNENDQIAMKGFDGTSVLLPCSKVEGKVKKVALNSNLLEKVVKQLKKGNITISIADDINTPCRIQNGTIDEPVKDSILFLLKTNIEKAEAEAKKEAEATPEEE